MRGVRTPRVRTRRPRPAAVAATAALLPLLGACGIQETDVIEAGGPATVQAFFDHGYDVLLFFRAPDGGLSPVIWKAQPSSGFGPDYTDPNAAGTPPVPTEKAVLALLNGPRPEDSAAGLTTALPTATPRGPLTVEAAPAGEVTAHVPLPLAGLDTTALHQLTCTIAYNEDPGGQAVVHLTGEDGNSATETCDIAPAAPPTAPARQARTTRPGGTG
ncbi:MULTISPECIES: hypothetical protein [unclassified Streptomyces]|uniref:hypothetical protein n=1 Tax=unclassified Streptomyces TaxID=2593676 RepID=UPI003D732859